MSNKKKKAVSIPKASSSQDGLMVEEDKAKVDGVEHKLKYTFSSSYDFCSSRCKAGETKLNDASGTVSVETFNGLLTALKNAGIMVK